MATVANRADAAMPVTADAPAFRVGSRPAPATRPQSLRTDTGPRRTRLAGNVSIDMDTLSAYARGYGFAYDRRPDPVYETGLTRFLDVMKANGIRSTIFAVGSDALVPEHRAVLERAAAEGHEIANHTLTHPRKLASLSPDDLRREIGEAHEILSEIQGRPVCGFRAPCYDISGAVLDVLREMNYLYDSSVHPTFLTPVIDLVVFLKSRCRVWEARPGTYLHLLSALKPYYPGRRPWMRGNAPRTSPGNRGALRLLEIPLSAAPLARLPFYGTFIQAAGMKMFHRLLNWSRRFRNPLSFHFHAVELVAMTDPGVDPRLAVHPGLSRPGEQKIADVNEMLAAFGAHYDMMTLEEMAINGWTGESR